MRSGVARSAARALDQARPACCTSIGHVLLADLAADMYPGQTAPVTSPLDPILLVTRAELPEELVHAATKVLLNTHHADPKAIHPGAARFYAEKGFPLR